MEVVDRPDGIRVVDDAYNASPEAVTAALRALAHMGRSARPPRRTWAVLGEMLELGEASRVEHDRVGRLAVRLNIDRLVAVGHGALHIDQGATQEGSWGEESALVDGIDEARRPARRRAPPRRRGAAQGQQLRRPVAPGRRARPAGPADHDTTDQTRPTTTRPPDEEHPR